MASLRSSLSGRTQLGFLLFQVRGQKLETSILDWDHGRITLLFPLSRSESHGLHSFLDLPSILTKSVFAAYLPLPVSLPLPLSPFVMTLGCVDNQNSPHLGSSLPHASKAPFPMARAILDSGHMPS